MSLHDHDELPGWLTGERDLADQTQEALLLLAPPMLTAIVLAALVVTAITLIGGF